MKLCRICKENLSLDRFVKNKAFKSGYDTICLDCSRQKVKEWRQAGKRNCQKEASLWYTRYPEKGRAKEAKHRAAKLRAIPKWANLEKIKTIYSNCPVGYHVDHIVPLQSNLVCGLHVEDNLQYLPAKENMAKGNLWIL